VTGNGDEASIRARPVFSSHVLNGRAGGLGPGERAAGGTGRRGGWLVRLTFSWDPSSPDHAWLTVTTEPSRPGPPTGAWLVPLWTLRAGLTGTASAGSVSLRPAPRPAAPSATVAASGGRVPPDRLWLEIHHVRGVWSAEVPTRWVEEFLASVAAG
jgi:hypothetical protein